MIEESRPAKLIVLNERGERMRLLTIRDTQMRTSMNAPIEWQFVGIEDPSPLTPAFGEEMCAVKGHDYSVVAAVYRDGVAAMRCSRCEDRAVLSPEVGFRLMDMFLTSAVADGMSNHEAHPLDSLLRIEAAVEITKNVITTLQAGVDVAQESAVVIRERVAKFWSEVDEP